MNKIKLTKSDLNENHNKNFYPDMYDYIWKASILMRLIFTMQVCDQTEELLTLTESWFNRLCSNPFDAVWSVAKQPFSDIRVAAMNVLKSLALVVWGQQLMNNAAGFKEYLLDRTIENTKESKESKFEVVKTLAESPTVQEVFGRPYYVQLMEFYRQGPFHVQAQSEVAFEETWRKFTSDKVELLQN